MITMVEESELLTVREVADRLRVSIDTVRRYIRRGDIPVVRLGAGVAPPIRVRTEALADFIGESHDEAPA
jgi:excisionase family DNA binding protein